MKKILITLAFLFTTTYFFSGSGPTYDTINPTSCGIYTSPAGNNYSASSMFNDTLSNSTGFDSIITVNLTVTNLTADSVSMDSWCDGSTQITVHNSAIGVTYSVIDTSTGNRFTGVTDQTGTGSNLFFGVWLTQDTVLEVIAIKNGCSLSLGYLEGKYIPSQIGGFIDTIVCGTYLSPNGRIITADSLFDDTITIASNCYYIESILVTFSGPSYDTVSVSSCGSYTSPSGNVYTSSGSFTDTITRSNGCDSIVTFNLTIGNLTADSVSIDSWCDGSTQITVHNSTLGVTYSVIDTSTGNRFTGVTDQTGTGSNLFFGVWLTQDTVLEVIATKNGCTLSLGYLEGKYIPSQIGGFIDTTVCGTYISPNGRIITTDSLFDDTITIASNCYYIESILVTISGPSYDTVSVSSCGSYTSASGNVYTSSATYNDTITKSNNCDSITTTILTVTNLTADSVSIDSWCDGSTQITVHNSTLGVIYSVIDTSTENRFTGVTDQTGTSSDLFFGVWLTQDTVLEVIATKNGCTLSLGYLKGKYIPSQIGGFIDTIVCGTYISPNGRIITTDSLFDDTITIASNCYYIESILVTISGPSYDTVSVSSCGNYTSPSGNVYTSSATYNDTMTKPNNCDSITTTILTVTNLTADSVSIDSWCDGSTQITVHNSTLGVTYSVIDTSTGNRFTGVTDQTGTGSDLFFGLWLTQDTVLEVIATKNGCTLSLGYLEGKYIPSQPGVFIDTTVCGTYISPKGRIITTDSLFEDTITIGSNCYYIIPITVTFSGPSYDTLNVSSCGSYTSPSGNVYTSSATYNDTITKSNNCDSIITINLTITNPTSSSISLSSCSNYNSPSGKTLSVSGIYKDTIVNSYGCDSLITISFTKLSGSSSSMTVTACDSYTAPSGKIFISSGTVKDTIANTAGCDSIITISLTINSVSTGTSVSGITLSANLSGATYQWLDCNNGYSPISGEISQTYTPTANGNYAVEITTSSCTDTSTCQSINSVGIKKTDKTQLLVYPNPVINSLTVKGVELSKSTWMVTTINGQQLTLQSYRNTINTESLASGTYMLRIETTDGIYFRKFIKR